MAREHAPHVAIEDRAPLPARDRGDRACGRAAHARQGRELLEARGEDARVSFGDQAGGALDLHGYLEAHRGRIRKLADGRLHIPAHPAHIEMHNPWAVNRPGTTLIFPVADLAQHHVAALCYLVQNGACIFDDVHGNPIPGLERFSDLVDVTAPYPLTFVEQLSLTEVTAELWRGDVIPDYRDPGGLRIGLSPLSTSFAEVERGIHAVREALDRVA